MGETAQFDAVLRKKKGRNFPKKILLHNAFEVSDHYKFKASVWIANTPTSNLRPTANLTLQHNGHVLRFCFENASYMAVAFANMAEWLKGIYFQLNEKHRAALDEFFAAHQARMLPSINDYTISTVIQGGSYQESGGMNVDMQTGEILAEEECLAKSTSLQLSTSSGT